MRYLLIIGLIMVLAPIVRAQITLSLTPQTRIGTADLIVLGTVKEVVYTTKETQGSVIIQVNRTLKGPTRERVTISNLKWMSSDHLQRLQVGQQRLFFLQIVRNAYVLPNGPLSVMQIADERAIANAIAAFPLEMSLAPPVGPFFFSEQEVTVQLKVKNVSQLPIGIVGAYLKGFYYAPSLPLNLDKDLLQPKFNPEDRHPKITIIPAGEEVVLSLRVVFRKPTAWKNVQPGSYWQTAIGLRAETVISLEVPYQGIFKTYIARTPLVVTTIGFQLPPQP